MSTDTGPTPAETTPLPAPAAPKPLDPISRKLVAGTGLGAALTVVLFEALRLSIGYTPSTEMFAAVQAIVGFVAGWWVKEEI